MYSCPIELRDVRYNAAAGCFEALVTVHDNSTVRKYACAIPAPITTSFEKAAKGLSKQAIRKHQQNGGLFSDTQSVAPPRRVGRSSQWSFRLLQSLVALPGRTAA